MMSDTLIHHFNYIKMKYDVQEYFTAVMGSFPRPQPSHQKYWQFSLNHKILVL